MKQKANKQIKQAKTDMLKTKFWRVFNALGFKLPKKKKHLAEEEAAFGFLHTIEAERQAYNNGEVKDFRPFRQTKSRRLPVIEEKNVLNPSNIIDAQLRHYNARKPAKAKRQRVDLVSGLIYALGILLAIGIGRMLWPTDNQGTFKPPVKEEQQFIQVGVSEPQVIEVKEDEVLPAATANTPTETPIEKFEPAFDKRGNLFYGMSIGPILQPIHEAELRLPRLQALPPTDTLSLDLKVREWHILRTNDSAANVRLPVIADNIKVYAAAFNILWDCNAVNLADLRTTRDNLVQMALDNSSNNNVNSPAYNELKIYLAEKNKDANTSTAESNSAETAANSTETAIENADTVSTTAAPTNDENTQTTTATDSTKNKVELAADNNNLSTLQIDRAKYRPEKTFYLTYDFPTGLQANAEKVLDLLKLYNARASFFISGDFLSQRPDLVLRMDKENHVIGSLGWTLEDAARISARNEKTFLKNLTKLDDNFRLLAGRRLDSFFRPPEGSFSQHVLWLIRNAGYYPTFWGLEMHDFWPDSKNTLNYRFDILRGRDYNISKYPYTVEQALNLIKQELHPGLILRLDGRSKVEVDLLEPLLKYLSEKGYTCLNLNDIPLELIGKQDFSQTTTAEN